MPKDDEKRREKELDEAMLKELSALSEESRHKFKEFIYLLASDNGDKKELFPSVPKKEKTIH